jgi:hypothetical protein
MTRAMTPVRLAALFALAGCASAPVHNPGNVEIGSAHARAWPATAANDAPPNIQTIALSSEDVRRGQTWSGEIVTSTNVASVEVRTNLFSLDVPRRTFGRFAFALNLLDVPPIFIRKYRLRVIARNTAGAEQEEDLPFRIR